MRYRRPLRRLYRPKSYTLTLVKPLIFIIIFIILALFTYNKYTDNKYLDELDGMSKSDISIISEVIDICLDKISLEYVWGGKGEIMTDKRLDELIGYYGTDYYPLDRDKYIGIQAFDCSGLTYFSYKEVTGVHIGYSTTEQKEVLKNYEVDFDDIQPGDLIFTPGHVVMYIGKGEVVQSRSKEAYPIGGVVKSSVKPYKRGDVFRPIDFINDKK